MTQVALRPDPELITLVEHVSWTTTSDDHHRHGVVRHEGILSLPFSSSHKKQDLPVHHEVDNFFSRSASSEPLQVLRYPREEINLATFVTRRPGEWQRRLLTGEECFLIVDD
jgi:hypothetical protein